MTDETIFATALEKADPAERAAFLAEACGDDAARRKRLEGLLMAHARAADILERPPGAAPGPDRGATPRRTYFTHLKAEQLRQVVNVPAGLFPLDL